MFGSSSRHDGASKPPVDLNKPVENPRVVAAIQAVAEKPTSAAQDALTRALRAANFLVPILADELHAPIDDDGMATIEAGSTIKILTCEAPDGEVFLPLFTDWAEIREWTDRDVSTLVMPAAEAFQFAASEDHAGAVVNPGGYGLPLDKELLTYLLNGA